MTNIQTWFQKYASNWINYQTIHCTLELYIWYCRDICCSTCWIYIHLCNRFRCLSNRQYSLLENTQIYCCDGRHQLRGKKLLSHRNYDLVQALRSFTCRGLKLSYRQATVNTPILHIAGNSDWIQVDGKQNIWLITTGQNRSFRFWGGDWWVSVTIMRVHVVNRHWLPCMLYSTGCYAGFMCGTTVLDKDGVSAAMVCAEMAAYLAKKGLTLTQQLELIYEKWVGDVIVSLHQDLN